MKLRYVQKILVFSIIIFSFNCIIAGGLSADFGKGIIELNKNNFLKATEHFKNVLDANPENPIATFYYGHSLYMSGKKKLGQDYIQLSILLDPFITKNKLFIDLYNGIKKNIIKRAIVLGLMAERKKMYKRAEKIYQSCLLLAPDEKRKQVSKERLKVVQRKIKENNVEHLNMTIKKYIECNANPNPFNLYTTISVKTFDAGKIDIYIANQQNQIIKHLIENREYAGQTEDSIYWYGDTDAGDFISAGKYKIITFFSNKDGKHKYEKIINKTD